MKYLPTTYAVFMATGITLAMLAAGQLHASEPTDHEQCVTWGDFAEDLMYARADGVTLRDQMEGTEPDSYTRRILMQVYDMPNFKLSFGLDKTAREYGDKVYQHCMRSKR